MTATITKKKTPGGTVYFSVVVMDAEGRIQGCGSHHSKVGAKKMAKEMGASTLVDG